MGAATVPLLMVFWQVFVSPTLVVAISGSESLIEQMEGLGTETAEVRNSAKVSDDPKKLKIDVTLNIGLNFDNTSGVHVVSWQNNPCESDSPGSPCGSAKVHGLQEVPVVPQVDVKGSPCGVPPCEQGFQDVELNDSPGVGPQQPETRQEEDWLAHMQVEKEGYDGVKDSKQPYVPSTLKRQKAFRENPQGNRRSVDDGRPTVKSDDSLNGWDALPKDFDGIPPQNSRRPGSIPLTRLLEPFVEQWVQDNKERVAELEQLLQSQRGEALEPFLDQLFHIFYDPDEDLEKSDGMVILRPEMVTSAREVISSLPFLKMLIEDFFDELNYYVHSHGHAGIGSHDGNDKIKSQFLLSEVDVNSMMQRLPKQVDSLANQLGFHEDYQEVITEEEFLQLLVMELEGMYLEARRHHHGLTEHEFFDILSSESGIDFYELIRHILQGAEDGHKQTKSPMVTVVPTSSLELAPLSTGGKLFNMLYKCCGGVFRDRSDSSPDDSANVLRYPHARTSALGDLAEVRPYKTAFPSTRAGHPAEVRSHHPASQGQASQHGSELDEHNMRSEFPGALKVDLRQLKHHLMKAIDLNGDGEATSAEIQHFIQSLS